MEIDVYRGRMVKLASVATVGQGLTVIVHTIRCDFAATDLAHVYLVCETDFACIDFPIPGSPDLPDKTMVSNEI